MLREGSSDVPRITQLLQERIQIKQNPGFLTPHPKLSQLHAGSINYGEKNPKLLRSQISKQYMLLYFSEDYTVYLLGAAKCQPDDTCNPELI